jgi:hypothetical protein
MNRKNRGRNEWTVWDYLALDAWVDFLETMVRALVACADSDDD